MKVKVKVEEGRGERGEVIAVPIIEVKWRF
jgi:hypothetical protein